MQQYAVAKYRTFIWTIFLALTTLLVSAQSEMAHNSSTGMEIQQYPTGFLFGFYQDWQISKCAYLEGRLGYNLVRHGDAGVHDDERGGGFGGSIGLHWILGRTKQTARKAWILGGRIDLWFNNIDWKDAIDFGYQKGSTKAMVLQPTALVGHQFSMGNQWLLTPTLAFGAEVNVREEGGEVGEGLILLWGLRFARIW